MNDTLVEFLQLDLPAMLAGSLAALACALPGNFLVLRRQSLLGDAVSHVVLLGIVLGFLITGSTDTWAMLGGAVLAALVAVLLIELLGRVGRIERGAAMGVVFTTMFAGGVVLLEQSGASGVHIDVQHSLYGNIEGTVWLGATGWGDLFDPAKLAEMPASIGRLLLVVTLLGLATALAFKELKIATFDPALGDTLGISSRLVAVGIMVASALAAVAAFDAVGSILVIAMFICPPATARMLTDDLGRQILLSAGLAVVAGLAGYVGAALLPLWLGAATSLSAAGMIAVTAGLMQLAAMLWAPRYGVMSRRRRHARSAAMAPADIRT